MGRPKGGKNRRWTVEEKLRIVNRHLEHRTTERATATTELPERNTGTPGTEPKTVQS